MEKLLNKLIEKGWRPRWFEKVYNFWIKNWYTVLDTKKANYISFATSCVFREDYWEEQKMDYVSYTYRELVRSLLRYYRWIEDEIAEKRYKRLWKIKNPGVWKPYGRSIADIAIKKWINFSL